ncbi:hypothetical protein M422DRAFT_134696, partial [Sphaerobolus stellatus SS14]
CIDCDTSGLYCTACLMQSHTRSPLHRVKTWNGTYFEESSLASAGLTLKLGHDPALCDSRKAKNHSHLMTVMDTNGLHNVRLTWCRCYGFSQLGRELLRLQWVLATLVRPGTAFTFRVLKHFQMLSHVARTTPWDFCNAIQRITDNIQPDLLPDIYRSFNRIQHIWRVARAYKRGGVTSVSRYEMQLGMQCVSCSWPGKNIPDNW